MITNYKNKKQSKTEKSSLYIFLKVWWLVISTKNNMYVALIAIILVNLKFCLFLKLAILVLIQW